jgi:hypothetical protein
MRAYTISTRGQRTASRMRAYNVPTRGQRTPSREMTKQNITQMEAYTVPTRGQRTTSREVTKWNMIQMKAYTIPTRGQRIAFRMGAYTVPTRDQRTASRETTKWSRIQTQIWSPILNTERHGILIAQIWIKNLNHIKNSKNIILIKRKILWQGRTRQMTGSVDNRQAKVRSVYIDQGECNP